MEKTAGEVMQFSPIGNGWTGQEEFKKPTTAIVKRGGTVFHITTPPNTKDFESTQIIQPAWNKALELDSGKLEDASTEVRETVAEPAGSLVTRQIALGSPAFGFEINSEDEAVKPSTPGVPDQVEAAPEDPTAEKLVKYQLEDYTEVYQFRLTLIGTRPSIWRRIQVPSSYTFFDLHIAIQDTMQGWLDLHYHQFKLPDGSIINYAGRQAETKSRNHNGWDVMIRDYFSLSSTKQNGDKKQGRKRKSEDNPSPSPPDDSASPQETASDSGLSFKNTVGNCQSEVEPESAEALEQMDTDDTDHGDIPEPQLTLVTPEICDAPSKPSSDDENHAKSELPVQEELTTISPVHIYDWKILLYPPEAQPDLNPVLKQTYGFREMNAVESLLSLSSGSFSSGHSPQQEQVLDTPGPEPSADAKLQQTPINKKQKVLPRTGKKCMYMYDSHDKWQISVILEHIMPRASDRTYPICIGGKRHGPPEHCGGVTGYYNLLQETSNPPGTERWLAAMSKLCDTERDLVKGFNYNANGFCFKDVVFQDPRKILMETEKSFPIPPNKRHENFLSVINEN